MELFLTFQQTSSVARPLRHFTAEYVKVFLRRVGDARLKGLDFFLQRRKLFFLGLRRFFLAFLILFQRFVFRAQRSDFPFRFLF